MPEHPSKKIVSISITRNRSDHSKTIVFTGFKMRVDKSTGMIDIFLEGSAQKGERIIFDPVLMQTNSDSLKTFVTAVPVEPDGAAVKEHIIVTEQSSFANIVHLSRIGNTGESIFAFFALTDWANESRQSTRTDGTVKSYDSLIAISRPSVQKKLILDLLLLIEQIEVPK